MKNVRWVICVLIVTLCIAGPVGAAKKATDETEAEDGSLLKSETFAGLEIRNIGPALMSGRIADIAVHPEDQSVWYVAVGSGNLWKTTNAGTTWETIFDDQGSYSIGDVTLDPNNPETVWVGTGENVGGRHVGYGDGVYKSLDGGQTWKNMGLEDSAHIGRILVDPRNSNVVWVAAHGPLWSAGGERGLFKTTDGGETWENTLSGGTHTGVNEMVMDPRDPDVLYAATHQRFRTVAALIDGGPESGIHKTTDGGATWTELETGLPEEDMGRIGLAISPQNPDVVYATIELAWRKGGFYRSANGGTSWENQSDYLSGGTGPHYYQEIYASPHAFDRIYQMDVRLHWSQDGGKTFTMVGEQDKHGDNHAIAFNADDPDYLLVGADGGLYETWDLGKSWKFITNLPITQFYKVAVDYDEPFYNIYGGTQDNNTQGGPSRTVNVNGIRSSDWFITLFGDGHQPAVDYSNPDIIYSEWQEGNLSRFDRKTGEMVYIQPQPEKGAPAERFNWDSPILISPHDPARLYFASQRVWRSDDRGDSWTAISGDLSRGRDRLTMPMMDGRVWSVDSIWDLWAMSNYANVTSLAESPVVEGLLYAGTDDGLIQASEDNGANWRRIDSFSTVPAETFVNDVKADLFDADTVYAAFDNHKRGDFKPYLLKSTDRGRTWTSIAGDLPDRHLVWRVVQDHERPELLFAGTEFGIFFTVDGGQKWVKLTGGVPNIPFRDLAIQKRENDLVGASFGRSFFVFDDYTPLRQVSEEMLEQEATLFPVRDAWWYVEKRPLGRSARATQGADFYVSPNPPFGAVFTYYLKDGFKTKKAERQEAEKKVAEEGGDTPNPGWDALESEAREEEPAILFTISDASGSVVRRMTVPAGKGFHRQAWDLRFPETDAITTLEEEQQFGRDVGGPLVEPGRYTVAMAKRVGGEVTSLGEPQSFEVKRMFEGTLPGASAAEMVAFSREIAEVNRQVDAVGHIFDTTAEQLTLIKHALVQSTHSDSALDDEARELERRLLDLRRMIYGSEEQDELGEPVPHSIGRRLSSAAMGNMLSTHGPTPNHQQTLAIAQEELAEVKTGLAQLVEVDLLAFEDKLDAAGVPWTPGRGVPD